MSLLFISTHIIRCYCCLHYYTLNYSYIVRIQYSNNVRLTTHTSVHLLLASFMLKDIHAKIVTYSRQYTWISNVTYNYYIVDILYVLFCIYRIYTYACMIFFVGSKHALMDVLVILGSQQYISNSILTSNKRNVNHGR